MSPNKNFKTPVFVAVGIFALTAVISGGLLFKRSHTNDSAGNTANNAAGNATAPDASSSNNSKITEIPAANVAPEEGPKPLQIQEEVQNVGAPNVVNGAVVSSTASNPASNPKNNDSATPGATKRNLAGLPITVVNPGAVEAPAANVGTLPAGSEAKNAAGGAEQAATVPTKTRGFFSSLGISALGSWFSGSSDKDSKKSVSSQKVEAQNPSQPIDVQTVLPGAPKAIDAGKAGIGANGVVVPGSDSVKTPEQLEKEALANATGCFSITYHHKQLSSHSSDEDCSRHKNLLRLKHPRINMASLCVRVNNKAVAWEPVKGKDDEVIIAPVAGPKAKISARYCLGKVSCAEECKIAPAAKDEFMEAIGGNDDDGKNPLVGQWDPNDADHDGDVVGKIDPEMKKELAAVNENSGTGDNIYIFQDWISESEAPACEKKQTDRNARVNADSSKKYAGIEDRS